MREGGKRGERSGRAFVREIRGGLIKGSDIGRSTAMQAGSLRHGPNPDRRSQTGATGLASNGWVRLCWPAERAPFPSLPLVKRMDDPAGHFVLGVWRPAR